MKARMLEEENSCVAATVAPEDLRRGDFVAVLSQIVELPTFLWDDILPNSRDELVRIRYLPTDDRVPLKVKAICLPFVFVKSPSDQYQTMDIRLANLVRLHRAYAKKVWKRLRTPAVKVTLGCGTSR